MNSFNLYDFQNTQIKYYKILNILQKSINGGPTLYWSEISHKEGCNPLWPNNDFKAQQCYLYDEDEKKVENKGSNNNTTTVDSLMKHLII